ncbi:hypothetical protein MT997_02780 [Paenibacillus sp. OVF10]|nr:hypothetical protein MT997_02780 [Paenibacillus sp. OVF10]
MDKLKNSGFYKLRFFITPEEFKSLLQLLEHRQAQFYRTNATRTEHDYRQVYEGYQTFYQYFVAGEREMTSIPSLFTLFLLHQIKKVQDFL